MLDAIADFWKPVRRLQASTRLKPEELHIGSAIVFGFVPQPNLSGRKLTVNGINTYKFGPDILTSFVLTQEQDTGVSMIIAETGGEHYLAISRRISISDRNRLFAHEDVEAVIASEDVSDLHSRDVTPEYKGWIAPHYKRELKRVKGQLYKGDHRAGLVSGSTALDFTYTLLVSDNNEHALEIEQYDDGRVEVYATVYRRMSDVGEVTHPESKEVTRPDVKLVSNGAAAPSNVAPKQEPKLPENADARAPEVAKPKIEAAWPEAKEQAAPENTTALLEKPAEAVQEKPVEKPAEKPANVEEHAVTKPVSLREFPAEAVAKKEETPAARAASVTTAALPTGNHTITIQANTQPYHKQEIKAVNKEASNFVNESIDCELQVANRIIDEAIRQEMRINDVVRKVIGLPVSQQESVQIPVTLTDQDYALLAIRYGISASDQDAIKRRITEDLADFSGARKKAA